MEKAVSYGLAAANAVKLFKSAVEKGEANLGKDEELGFSLAKEAEALQALAEQVEQLMAERGYDMGYFGWLVANVTTYLKDVSEGVFRTLMFQLPSRKERAYVEMSTRIQELGWMLEQFVKVLKGENPDVE